jgi:phosphoribosyl-AMP cyclohydrolase
VTEASPVQASQIGPNGVTWLDTVRFDAQGLIPAIAQNVEDGEVLMVAWMNRESLAETVATGRAVYWSRSRQRLWRKGEESGHTQTVLGLRIDCDADVILLEVEQTGGVACHTGRRRCFYRRLESGVWQETEAPLVDPETIYQAGKKTS